MGYMQYLTMLTKGRVAEEVDQKEKEGLAYYEYVSSRLGMWRCPG